MTDQLPDIADLLRRVADAEGTLDAIRTGSIDGLVVTTANGPRVYTLEGADAFYRALIEQMGEGAVAVRPDGTILYANNAMASMINSPAETVVGSALHSIVVLRDHDRCTLLLGQAAVGSEAQLSLQVAGQLESLPVSVTARVVRDGEGENVTCLIVSDQTATIAAELIRRDAQLLTDRERMARELHDTVIQSLFACGLRLESMTSHVGQPVAEQLTHIIDEIDETIRELRLAIFDLRPPSIFADLAQSIQRIIDAATHNLGFTAEVAVTGDLTRVPDTAVGDLLASLRESLSNASRHAGASSLRVNVDVTETELVLVVDDDGRGIGSHHRSSGLDNLLARADSHRGTFTALSLPGRPGTVATWRIPLDD